MFGAAFPLASLSRRSGTAPPPPPPTPPPPTPPPPPPPGTTYANGYAFRRRFHIPANRFSASHGTFPLLIDETLDTCRTVANGGNVQNASGWDIRFEDVSGVKLAHDLERYVASTGEIVAWVQITASNTASSTFFMYYGRSGLAASEANPATVWSGYLAVYHLPSVIEAGGRTARNLTTVGTVGSDTTTMIGASMSVAGNGLLKLDNVTWLDNLNNLTVQVRAKPT